MSYQMPPNPLIQNAMNEAFGAVVTKALEPVMHRLETIEKRLRDIEEQAREINSAIDKAKSGNSLVGRLLSG